jgi:hypothetical protein
MTRDTSERSPGISQSGYMPGDIALAEGLGDWRA